MSWHGRLDNAFCFWQNTSFYYLQQISYIITQLILLKTLAYKDFQMVKSSNCTLDIKIVTGIVKLTQWVKYVD